MQLATVDMPVAEARAKFREYRSLVRERLTAEDEQIMAGYKAIVRGQRVISLRQAISNGGTFNTGRPRIAVARATASICWLEERTADGAVTFTTNPNRHTSNRRDVCRFPVGTLPDLEGEQKPFRLSSSHFGLKAIVPPIPPAYRPARGLHLYDILWEVPKWERVPNAPGDPALIRKIGGDLYAVVAQWDLTELERLVINSRVT